MLRIKRMFPKYNTYDPNVTYPVEFKDNSLTKDFLTHLEITVAKNQSFIFKTVDFYPSKQSPKIFHSQGDVKKYLDQSTMSNWYNQLNFAIYCATSGCGVSADNHINHQDPLVRSIFRFHIYFTIRKILHQLQVPLPGNKSFNEFNNYYDKQKYEQLRIEFGKNELIYINISQTHVIIHPHFINFPIKLDSPERF